MRGNMIEVAHQSRSVGRFRSVVLLNKVESASNLQNSQEEDQKEAFHFFACLGTKFMTCVVLGNKKEHGPSKHDKWSVKIIGEKKRNAKRKKSFIDYFIVYSEVQNVKQ